MNDDSGASASSRPPLDGVQPPPSGPQIDSANVQRVLDLIDKSGLSVELKKIVRAAIERVTPPELVKRANERFDALPPVTAPEHLLSGIEGTELEGDLLRMKPAVCRAVVRSWYAKLGFNESLASNACKDLDDKRRDRQRHVQKILEVLLALEFLQMWDRGRLVFLRDVMYAWNGRYYKEIARQQIELLVTEVVAESPLLLLLERPRLTTGEIRSVIQIIRSIVQCRHWDVASPFRLDTGARVENLIVVGNGVLDLHEPAMPVLVPHSDDLFTLVGMSYRYDPTATCPRWLAFLEENLEGDRERIDILQEWFGLNLVPTTRFEKFMLMIGEGANGKSVALDVLKALVGDENVASIALNELMHRFTLTPLIGKLANIVSELSESRSPMAEGKLKALVSGEKVLVEVLHSHNYSTAIDARHTFACNNLPRFRDRSDGLWRRMLVTPWRKIIPIERRDLGLAAHIVQHELDGVFLWALAGLQRLMANRRFSTSTVMEELKAQYRKDVNPAEAFLREAWDPPKERTNGQLLIGKDALYQQYSNYCRSQGFHPVTHPEFAKVVIRLFPDVRQVRLRTADDTGRPRSWDFSDVDLATLVADDEGEGRAA